MKEISLFLRFTAVVETFMCHAVVLQFDGSRIYEIISTININRTNLTKTIVIETMDRTLHLNDTPQTKLGIVNY